LIYEIAWLRMLRLVFGASTGASAAVLAIFLGGLGFGGLLLGRRADRSRNPLGLYANLEMGVALAAAASPLLITLVRHVYLALGGTATLGLGGGTAVRLGLSALVLGLPTFLMGGTLPAAVRAVARASDPNRRVMGLLYGANTAGAVVGSCGATFVLLEQLGTNRTVWFASLLNLAVAFIARVLASWQPSSSAVAATDSEGVLSGSGRPGTAPPDQPRAAAPVTLILVAAGVVGFAFLLMELVWYRMLAPLLGGSSYSFGLILSVALLGIGVGGLAYGSGAQWRRPTLITFAGSCVAEAFFIALPYALGDRLALFAMVVRPLGFLGFPAMVLTWLLVTLLVVFPAAVLSGYQFPLLVSLLGSGEQQVGREVGWAYAANTVGAILGSLAGGFGLLPLLTAPGVWRGVIYLLLALAALAVLRTLRDLDAVRRSAVPVLLGLLTALLCRAEGPTAFWRHSPIGAGRMQASLSAPNDLQRLLNEKRRVISWQADGVESTVALEQRDAYAFIVHGKSDGNVIGDAPTQVMAGLVGALVHPNVKRVLVIGLGTGSTAGWLAQIPSVERVDVVELEPAILHVAEVCSPVNHNVLANPKVHVIIGDGREFLQTTAASYDLVFSEPSNPYRAGVASLFTREFYEAVAQRLNDHGVFSQWVQAYEVEAQTLRTVYATLGAVFPSVETWEVKQGHDLLLTARRQPQPHDLALLQTRVESEPYRSALARVWGVSGVEGLYTGFVANEGLADVLRQAAGLRINTDDRTRIEFEFARMLGREGPFLIDELRSLAAVRHYDRPPLVGGSLDWARVEELRTVRAVAEGLAPAMPTSADQALHQRILARQAYASGNLGEARQHWLSQSDAPKGPMDITLVAEVLAAAADPRAVDYIEQLRPYQPVEVEALLALWHSAAQRSTEAVDHLIAAFRAYREFPWAHRMVLNRSIALSWNLSVQRPDSAGAIFDALSEPFAVRALDAQRLAARANIGLTMGFEERCVAALAPLEPWVPWDLALLQERVRCYSLRGHPLAARARADLDAFLATNPTEIDEGLRPEQPPSSPARRQS
jgi:spermidine synthase